MHCAASVVFFSSIFFFFGFQLSCCQTYASSQLGIIFLFWKHRDRKCTHTHTKTFLENHWILRGSYSYNNNTTSNCYTTIVAFGLHLLSSFVRFTPGLHSFAMISLNGTVSPALFEPRTPVLNGGVLPFFWGLTLLGGGRGSFIYRTQVFFCLKRLRRNGGDVAKDVVTRWAPSYK